MVESLDDLPFCIDHIVARKHHGPTLASNLALSCYHCNTYKGPNIAGIDPETAALTRLFNPRLDRWNEHFKWEGPELVGETAVGRTTIDVLQINHPDRVEHRFLLMAEGTFPPRTEPSFPG
jgi:hypothetical protein